MKKLLLIIAVSLTALTASAQQTRTFNERLYQAKLREMVYRLNITDEQKPKFDPVYRRYNEEMIAAWGERKKPEPPQTSQEAAALAKRKMERQQRAQAIRMKYIDEFAKVLTPHQVNRLYEVEENIQRQLKARKNGTNGQRRLPHLKRNAQK